ncbi:MAG: hypothetical protein QOG69_2418 [Actinomycetota bacterium]|nr:hypothetical protein [Actinomycetota bacterium]
MSEKLRSQTIDVPDSQEAMDGLVVARGWGDGLPVVPPTEQRVMRMLEWSDLPPETVLGTVGPKFGEASLEKLAISAVMAGCIPQYFPVVVVAMQAMLEERFNLYGIQATTHPVAPLIIVNGPIAGELGINSGYNAFGQGWRANATIGRAIRLALINIGGGLPGKLDRATLGSPAKYSFCIAENEHESPWEPLHVERGFDRDVSTVTVFGGEAPHNINDHGSISALGVLTTIAGTMAITGSNNVYYDAEPLLALSPEHAATVARDGLSKLDVKHFLFEHARIKLSAFSREGIERHHQHRWQGWRREAAKRFLDDPSADVLVPIAARAEDFIVIVVGGPGKHSGFVPSFGATTSVTRPIQLADGTAIASVKNLRRR